MSQQKASDLRCAGCPNTYKKVAFLNCSRCHDKYHYSCMNFNKEDYLSLSKSAKDSWVCPSCRCKEPRIGDNTNTPIRPTLATLSSSPNERFSDIDNVTLRQKMNTEQYSRKTCTCTTSDTIRDILRDELQQSLKIHFQEIKAQLESFENSLSFLNDQFDSIFKAQEIQKQTLVQQQKEIDLLRASNQDLSARLRQMDQLSRSNNIEIQSIIHIN